MRYMLAQLPLVGVVIGCCLWVWARFCVWLSFGPVLTAAGLTLLPVVLSGAIHMDGFCDTADALASHGDMEKKRAILKDSHTGAFAVIYTAAYLLANFAVIYEAVASAASAGAGGSAIIRFANDAQPFVFSQTVWMLALIQVLSRAIGGFAGTVFPKSSSNGLLAAFHDAAKKGSAVALIIWMVVCICLAGIPLAAAFALAAVLCLVFLYRMAKKNFGGMSGDLAGFIITISQLVLSFVYVIVMKLVI